MSDAPDADNDAPHANDDDVDAPTSEAKKARQSELMDEALEESFPASDPPSPKHIT